mmetsp:Transcript_880/g.951  ORF Transcript_880/g.951 Transcript_880/m.951 type:complete len:770 (-) Transcript_880:181-2490(-)
MVSLSLRLLSFIALGSSAVLAQDHAFVLLGPTGDNSLRPNGVWEGVYESWCGGVFDSSTVAVHPTMNTPHTEEELKDSVMATLSPLYASLKANTGWECKQPDGDCDPETFYDDVVTGNINIHDGRDANAQAATMIPAMKDYEHISVYLSVPPYTFGDWATATATNWGSERVVVAAEKPFGVSTEDANDLYGQIVADGVLKEDHLLLVDHWLSFFMVTNLPAFQTVVTECMGVEWNSKSFSKIVITEHETRGLDGRGSFFDNVGQVRDLIQSHLLQVTALLLVTPDDNGSKAKLEVLEDVSVRTCSHGQYDGFLLEPKLGYHKNFADATFSTMYLDMNMDKWNETNLEITTGKSMGTTLYTIEMYQAGGPGLLTIDIGAEEVGVADIKVADWPLENGECSFKAPMPGLEKEDEVDMTSSVSDEGTGVIVEYDTDSLYFPKPYAVMVTRMLSKDHGSGFVTFPEVNQSWEVITAGSPSICNDPPGAATLVYQPPSSCGNTPPKVCYTDDTVQDLYDVKYACTPDNNVEWKCLNFYQDKCGLDWNPPECDDWSPPTSDSSDNGEGSGSSDNSSHDASSSDVIESSSHDNAESSHDNMDTESNNVNESYDSSSHDNSHDNTDTCSTIFDLACNTDGFDTLCGLLTSFDLEATLSGGSWTIFAPTDEAFTKLDDALDGGIASVSDDLLFKILQFHAVEDQVLHLDDLSCESDNNLVTALNGKESRTFCKDDVPYGQKGGGNDDVVDFVTVDIDACNGVVHTIEGVLLFNLASYM